MSRHTTPDENEALTRVGAGTPMGELLRRYWWPIALSEKLKTRPTLARLLGEDLVLYRDTRGGLGLLSALCPHRRAPLAVGIPSANGLRCRYHGWLLDKTGRVLETPGEPKCSELKDQVRQPSYPVEELGGLVFAYLGPLPAPQLPRFHMLAAEGGQRNVLIQGFNDCNFLQCLENGIDAHHVAFLHGDTWEALAKEPETFIFRRDGLGVVVETIGVGREPGEFTYRRHPVILPGVSIGGDTLVSYGMEQAGGELPAATARWTVPIDDTHTINFRIWWRPEGQQTSKLETRTSSSEAVKIKPYLEYREGRDELGYVGLDDVPEQDSTIFEGTGPIADRENENLSVIDEGVVLLREILFEQMEVVRNGGDPLGVFREQTEDMIVIAGHYEYIDEDRRVEITEAS